MPVRRDNLDAEYWEDILRREGLAPLDQRIRGRVVVRTEIITPLEQYLPEPERLAEALRSWLRGRTRVFTGKGRRMLAEYGHGQQSGEAWTKMRARILLRICTALCEGKTVRQAITRRGDQDLAYRYLRPLAKEIALVDDDITGDDGAESNA